MFDIPYGKREPRTFPPSAPPEEKTFKNIGYSTPLNPQTVKRRMTQSGLLRPVSMKLDAPKSLDSRLSQLDRNRLNCFNERGSRISSLESTFPSQGTVTTRHGSLPVGVDTFYISKPALDSGMLPDPDEMYKTSYLSYDIGNASKAAKYAAMERHAQYKRERMQAQSQLVESIDKLNKERDEARWAKIKQEREDYLNSLKKRERLEKMKFNRFE